MVETANQERPAGPRIGWARLGAGLAQGLALYGLSFADKHKAWPASDKPLMAGLELALAFSPLILLAGIGHLRRWTLFIWFLAAAALSGALAAYQQGSALPDLGQRWLDTPFPLFVAAALFIAHHLIVPADQARKWVAPYPAYFDAAWLDGVRLGLAIAFAGVFWILLEIGASLFALIGLTGFRTFIAHDWFYFPATTVVFAAAAHIGDVRVGLTRGLRTVGLILLSWLLPVMAAIAIAFLVALPFTGLTVLWKANPATGEILTAVAALIVLLNAAYQDGGVSAPTPRLLRWTGRATALAIAPLTALAIWGLGQRIGEHGLTPSRIIAAACCLIAACYSLGYAFAALRPGRWLARLEPANVATSVLVVAVIVALFSPIADPARISVDDQLARLEHGASSPEKFDYQFLRFHAGRYGLAELKRLAAGRGGGRTALVAAMAGRALKLEDYCRFSLSCTTLPPERPAFTVFPTGAALPSDFEAAVPVETIAECQGGGQFCEAYLVDLKGDGNREVIVGQFQNYRGRPNDAGDLTLYAKGSDQPGWRQIGSFLPGCQPAVAALRAGAVKPIGPVWPDVSAGGVRLHLSPGTDSACPSTARGPASELRVEAYGPRAASVPR